MATMADAELVARRHQAEGAPVVIAYPPATLGPHDPHLGDQNARLRNALKGRIPVWPTGGVSFSDVRDIADLLAATVEPGFELRRCVPPATFLTTKAYVQTLRGVTGRRLPAARVPSRALLPVGWTSQFAQRLSRWHIPAEYGAIYACHCSPRFDDATIAAFPAPNRRPIVQTMTDTVRWLYAQGELTRRQAGAALDSTALDSTALDSTGLDGTAPDGTARPAVGPSRRVRAVPAGPVAPDQGLAA
jgi:nucleoside-diphosphate-sugar epimerase